MSSSVKNNIEKNNSETVRVAQLHYQGPLPPPEALARYEQIQIGLANRIVALAEQESQHRHEIDKTWLNKAFEQERRGQAFGLVIGVVAIVAGTVAAIAGSQIAGSIIGGGGVVGLVSVFVLGNKSKN
jgi:uncharacterized membrane protein